MILCFLNNCFCLKICTLALLKQSPFLEVRLKPNDVSSIKDISLKIRGFFLKKNKKYSYTPRYYEGKDIGNVYELDSRIRKYRDTPNNNHFTEQWKEMRAESRNRGNREINRTLIIVLIVLLLLVLYIFDFDLSFFTTSK
ncbi:conserved hypothetical protein [Capnocytophaga canimorsus]|uniref:Uncharacterized protein n=1 Tax=Capnocytophaga canimorsus TaxID=28188 RepID=A0A0B7HHH2_9FLAO|nr:hypothetical protein CLV61_1146 [Capnocytophaga canimorsus]CEN37003.1 conserved hypothetical protein [Capnocytophaga canimorsus]STA73302.1 Uncharacterised protein [Capnocytophaga canimorsus]